MVHQSKNLSRIKPLKIGYLVNQSINPSLIQEINGVDDFPMTQEELERMDRRAKRFNTKSQLPVDQVTSLRDGSRPAEIQVSWTKIVCKFDQNCLQIWLKLSANVTSRFKILVFRDFCESERKLRGSVSSVAGHGANLDKPMKRKLTRIPFKINLINLRST